MADVDWNKVAQMILDPATPQTSDYLRELADRVDEEMACHCGDVADCHGMCAPCKFAVNEACECSRDDQPGWSS